MDTQAQPTATPIPNAFADTPYLDVDTSLYPRPVLFRACYAYTDRCYLFLTPLHESAVRVRFRPRPGMPLDDVLGSFCNELIEQEIRYTLADETRTVRDLIVAQAFAEADFRHADIPR